MASASRPIGDYNAHCRTKAGQLRRDGFGQIHAGTVAYLLYGAADKQLDRCRKIAVILGREPAYDGVWHQADVALAYKLRRYTDSELHEHVYGPQRPKLPPQSAPPTSGPAIGFTQFLANKAQNAPSRS